MGIALSATCGFKVFVPVLCISICSKAGFISLTPSFMWLGSYPAIFLLSVATILEICAYYIPYIDNLLDTISIPAAAIAGIIVVSSTMVADISPMLKWTLAIIAGGGAGAAIKTTSAALRSTSAIITGGTCNNIVNTLETGSAFIGSLLAILTPILGSILVVCLIVLTFILVRRLYRSFKNKAKTSQIPAA